MNATTTDPLLEVIDLLTILENSEQRLQEVSTEFIETKRDPIHGHLCINANRLGLMRMAKTFLEVAVKNFEGAHQHLDEVSGLDSCDMPLVVCFKKAD
jgi:predicted transcriptional regulator YheO